MLVLVVLVGVACGTLLAAIGLVLWGGARRLSEFLHAANIVRWLAAALLLMAALLAWLGGSDPATLTPRLILMAALAALPESGRRQTFDWRNTALVLPALTLAGIGLLLAASSGGETAPPEANLNVSTLRAAVAAAMAKTTVPATLPLVVCGGLGARALGQALRRIVTPASRAGERASGPSPAAAIGVPTTYALLTLLVGTIAIANLWKRGTMWGAASDGKLAGAWLAWSAVWLGPRQPAYLRATLTIVAASALIVLAAAY